MYKDDTFMDKGTLKQLQNLINRSNVPKVVKNNYAGARTFFSVVLEAHLIATGLQFFGMNERTDTPTKKWFTRSHDCLICWKKVYIKSTFGKFVDSFALGFINDQSRIVIMMKIWMIPSLNKRMQLCFSHHWIWSTG